MYYVEHPQGKENMSATHANRLRSLAPVLARVAGPGQYVGGEHNHVTKPDAALRFALGFADVYAVGMSHHGIRILYDTVNAESGMAAERVFAPLPDMERELRARGARLATLETATPLCDCQVVGFSLSYELAATSILTMLDLGGIPLTRFEREGTAAPVVIAGGASTLNPEPLTDFVDVFLIGEGEESLPELLRIVRDALPITKDNRADILLRIAREVKSAYVPALYETAAQPDGTVTVTGAAASGVPFPVARRIVEDFDSAHQVTKPIVPIHETVHERAVLEIMRGCPNGCRFCQAGYATRPQRERSPESLRAAALACLANTGYDEVGLLSLSTSNYSRFDELVAALDAELSPKEVSLSLPSLRVDHALSGIPSRFKSVRKSGLTVAPEAGTDRLRAVINKHVRNEDLLAAAEEAFRQGWKQMKLYFMVGLPTETEEDVRAIAALAEAAAKKRPRGGKGNNRPAISLSVSNFVPKAHTAFQWFGAAHPDEWAARQALVRESVNRKLVAYHGHDVSTSLLEAVFARGDRRLGKALLSAWKNGARLDAWTEHFRPAVWNAAFADAGLDPVLLATRNIPLDAALPWDHIDSGLSKAFFAAEWRRAEAAAPTAPCAPGQCAGCGVDFCRFSVQNMYHER